LSSIDHHLPFVVKIDSIGFLSHDHDAPGAIGLSGVQQLQNMRHFVRIRLSDHDHVGLTALDGFKNAQVVNFCQMFELHALMLGQQVGQSSAQDIISIQQQHVSHVGPACINRNVSDQSHMIGLIMPACHG
jgi:hypothetical protein